LNDEPLFDTGAVELVFLGAFQSGYLRVGDELFLAN
jgi:hypothetical protein